MPRGPKGQARPADVIGTAIKVAKIATGEIEDEPKRTSGRVRSGQAGGRARADALTPEKRTEIAKRAARARWGT